MTEDDMNTILKSILLIEDNDKESYTIKGLAYDDFHDYYRVFESKEDLPMKGFKNDLIDFDLTTWSEFLKTKKQA